MKAEEVGRTIIKVVNGIVNIAVLTIILVLLALAGYALWDSKQLYGEADKSQYEIYKPSEIDEGKSFEELKAINPEVIAWLTVYGTHIDYPVTQGEDNLKYVNTSAEGQYSLSGAIFLDKDNSRDFTDFNSILYGHHMDKSEMFGDIGCFADREMFESHHYGNLFFGGKNYGIEFFDFIQADAYDTEVFTANVQGKEQQLEYIINLYELSVNQRDGIDLATLDRIVLLSTCSSCSTNGRDILIGRITDEVYEDPYLDMEENIFESPVKKNLKDEVREIPLLLLMLIMLLAARAVMRILDIYRRRKQSTR